MPSSGSTRSRSPDREIPLLLLFSGEDSPRACTGRRLLHAGLAREVSPGRPPRPGPVLLDPHAERPLGPGDRAAAHRGGLLIVDCSWNRLGARGGFPVAAPWLDRVEVRRRLPFVLAANPQHFGRLGELTTAEAAAAGLYLLGEPDRARALLGRFRGGLGFFELNASALARYTGSSTVDQLRAAETALYGRKDFQGSG
jgi:rRNA small subunit aminocarboxypropyltransferase